MTQALYYHDGLDVVRNKDGSQRLAVRFALHASNRNNGMQDSLLMTADDLNQNGVVLPIARAEMEKAQHALKQAQSTLNVVHLMGGAPDLGSFVANLAQFGLR